MDYLQQELKRLDQQINQAKASLSDPQLKSLAQEEIKKLKIQKQALKKAQTTPAKSTAFPSKEKSRQGNCILEVRAAAGGEEAKIWSEDLLSMYTRFAHNQNLEVANLDQGVIKIKGKQAYPLFKYEAGVHRVQRIPVTESQGRIHTSTATVTVLPEIKETEIHLSPKDLSWEFFRASSQGGQNVQKVSTAVRLTHRPSQITVECQTQRYQEQNRKIALDLLRSKLYQIDQEKKKHQLDTTRKKAVGHGMRAEKIRTYNFPQNRLTDHRLKKSWKNLDKILDGQLLPIIQALRFFTLASP
jgi:peptide chain release factor 1